MVNCMPTATASRPKPLEAPEAFSAHLEDHVEQLRGQLENLLSQVHGAREQNFGEGEPSMGGASLTEETKRLGKNSTNGKHRTLSVEKQMSELIVEVLRSSPATTAGVIAALSKQAAFDPREAGAALVRQMQQAEGGAWTGAELQARFELTPATLHRRRSEHRIVFWRDAKEAFHYPKWQFTPTGALLRGMQEVLQTFRSADEWRVMRYFLTPRKQLENQSPLALLQRDEQDKVIAHARIHGQENTW